MKRLIITEEEKNRILNLYEQSTTGNTNQSLTDDIKEFGISVIWKYKNELYNIVKMLISIFPTTDLEAYRTWRGQYCGTNESKLPQFLKTKITPILGLIDDFFIKLKTDLKVDSVQKAIRTLYETFNTPIFQNIIKFIGRFVDDEPIATEIVNEIQSYLRTKYGEEGSLFSSVLSGVLGKIGVNYYGICDFESGFYGTT
jgi:hypothetical protein